MIYYNYKKYQSERSKIEYYRVFKCVYIYVCIFFNRITTPKLPTKQPILYRLIIVVYATFAISPKWIPNF